MLEDGGAPYCGAALVGAYADAADEGGRCIGSTGEAVRSARGEVMEGGACPALGGGGNAVALCWVGGANV